MGINKSYEDLQVWKKAIDLAQFIYSITAQFPKEERYDLTSQLRRAAVSVSSNIAEGCARNSPGEFIQFLGIATGSLAEIHTQCIIANRLNYINEKNFLKVISALDEVRKMLSGLKASIPNSKPKLATRNPELATRETI